LFDDHKAYEASSRRKLKAYMEAYPEFKYESPFATPKDNFNILDFNQYEASQVERLRKFNQTHM
jgi:hypothetical protein